MFGLLLACFISYNNNHTHNINNDNTNNKQHIYIYIHIYQLLFFVFVSFMCVFPLFFVCFLSGEFVTGLFWRGWLDCWFYVLLVWLFLLSWLLCVFVFVFYREMQLGVCYRLSFASSQCSSACVVFDLFCSVAWLLVCLCC